MHGTQPSRTLAPLPTSPIPSSLPVIASALLWQATLAATRGMVVQDQILIYPNATHAQVPLPAHGTPLPRALPDWRHLLRARWSLTQP